MTTEWYIHVKDQQQGPYTWEQLWDKARTGELQPTDQVWADRLYG